MENILNKDIFDDRDLNELSPDYNPRNFVLRMQMRRTLVSKQSLFLITKYLSTAEISPQVSRI